MTPPGVACALVPHCRCYAHAMTDDLTDRSTALDRIAAALERIAEVYAGRDQRERHTDRLIAEAEADVARKMRPYYEEMQRDLDAKIAELEARRR